MQIIRTIVWLVLLVAILAFSVANWDQQLDVRIWEGLFWTTRLPAVVIVTFLLGMIPMWLLYRTTRWRLKRRIATLESSARLTATTPPPASNAASAPPAAAPDLDAGRAEPT